jgi:hypothetical protein
MGKTINKGETPLLPAANMGETPLPRTTNMGETPMPRTTNMGETPLPRTANMGGTPLPLGARMRYGACLPHLTNDNGIYSVTFRLADSLPKSVLVAWKQERDEIIAKATEHGQQLSKTEDDRLKRLLSLRIESYLDTGAGECWMKHPEIADLVERALKHFDRQRYELLCWCVMPNHVHVVVQPYSGYELSEIEHSWKSFTAHQANKLLRRSGVFWQA